jgi:hypothetical protein
MMTYGEFVEFLFSRADDRKEWYFAEDFVQPEFEADMQVDFATRIFTDAEWLASKYTESQFCLGLNYLINPACSSFCYSYVDTSVEDAKRVSVVDSMYAVFNKVFNEKCTELSSESATIGPANFSFLCYMWWDVFPRHGAPPNLDLESTDRTILATLEKIMSLDSLGCKESALHGLGHWHSARPELVERVIDRNSAKIPVALREYSKSARKGSVQ